MKDGRKIVFILFFFSLLLRVAWWNKFPPGFTADEATMGYDAYSLLKTGKDQFGTSWPLAFRSFGDYRPPLYIYASMPFVAIFGLTPLAVRLPSMIAGSLEIVLIYLVVKEIFSRGTGLFSAILLMLSPWSILQTRFAQEVNLSTLTIFAGITGFIFWIRKKKWKYIVYSALFFGLSFYSYHNARLTTPLILLGCLVTIKSVKKVPGRQVTVAVIIGILTVLPLMVWMKNNPQTMFRRASSQSVLADQGIKGSLWKDIVSMPPGYPVWLSRLQHNKPLYYGRVILKGYLSHFDPRFLFFYGDPHERFRTPYSGVLNWTMLLFLPIGLVMVVSRCFRGTNSFVFRLIVWWLLISPVVASLSTIVPNSQHAQDLMIPFHLIGGIGAAWLIEQIAVLRKPLTLSLFFVLCFLFLVSSFLFLYGYTRVIPVQTKYLQAWHYYGNLFEKLRPFYQDKIIFLGGQYYINLAFYLKVDPRTFQQEVKISQPDNLAEFDHVDSFGKFTFTRNRDIPKNAGINTLYVRLNESGEAFPEGIAVVDREVWPDGNREYIIFRYNGEL
jgi:4-amino-4-deoxy-L-arabinose transferase-like glycosyltransferase